MEEFKEVMLSEPPVRGYVPSSQGAGAGAAQGRSFENYKGILLCDRPNDHKLAVGVTEQPFLPPGRPDRDLFGMGGRGEGCLGLQPSQEKVNRHTVARQARHQSGKATSTTALSKHRKWLKELSTVTKHVKLGQVEAELEKEAKTRKFQDTERKKRHALKGSTRDPAAVTSVMGATSNSCYTESPVSGGSRVEIRPSPPQHAAHVSAAGDMPASPDSLPPLSPETHPSMSGVSPKPVPAAACKKEKAKPKWAMTEEEVCRVEGGGWRRVNSFFLRLFLDLIFVLESCFFEGTKGKGIVNILAFLLVWLCQCKSFVLICV